MNDSQRAPRLYLQKHTGNKEQNCLLLPRIKMRQLSSFSQNRGNVNLELPWVITAGDLNLSHPMSTSSSPRSQNPLIPSRSSCHLYPSLDLHASETNTSQHQLPSLSSSTLPGSTHPRIHASLAQALPTGSPRVGRAASVGMTPPNPSRPAD